MSFHPLTFHPDSDTKESGFLYGELVLVELTQEIVRELLDYNVDSGILIWKKRDVKWFEDSNTRSSEWACNWWNSRFSEKEAFTSILDGYKNGKILGISVRSHRIIWVWMTGEWPDQVDHKNGDRSDNRWENLQESSDQQNSKNRKMRVDNISGYKGVHWSEAKSRWIAQISENGRVVHIGNFVSAEKAFAAYCAKAKIMGYTDRHIFGESNV